MALSIPNSQLESKMNEVYAQKKLIFRLKRLLLGSHQKLLKTEESWMDENKNIEDNANVKESEKNEARKKVNDTHKKRVEELKKNNSKINHELTAAHKKNGDLERELKDMKTTQRKKQSTPPNPRPSNIKMINAE